jgi:dCTP deaminase
MPIKSDKWIRRMCEEHRMIEPFVTGQVRDGNISYGLSSYGYDIRVSGEFKVFTNVHNSIVDPKNFDERSFVEINGSECFIPPNSFALARTEEYFRIPRDVLVVCVGKSTYARCFSGDTRVALVDGTGPTMEEMARRHADGEMFWGYSLGEFGRIEMTLLDAPRYIDRDALLEITLDNCRTIRPTPDHEFVLRDGRRVQAHELRPNDSLMPLYRELVRGFESVYQPLNGHLYPTHRLADEWNLRNSVYVDEPGTHRHHRDHDRRNNNPWNIERSDERRDAARRRVVRRYSDPRERRLQGERMRAAWAADDGSRRAKQSAFRGRRAGAAKNHKVTAIRELAGVHDVYCLTVPEAGNFAIDAGVFVGNCGLIVNVTPLEPTWEGYLTLEISNTTPLPAKVYGGEGIAQLLFFEGDEEPEVAYADRQGKYMKQTGVTLPKM